MTGPRLGLGGKSHPSNVGMMDAAFFVGRSELLTWVNSTLHTSLTKVEQCASGAVYCQLLDACHPGVVQMKRVNWMAKVDHEHIPNYKILQAAFSKLGVDRNIDVDKLIKGKYQDNLEFLQWMKCYFEHSHPSHSYGGGGLGEDGGYNPLPAREGKPLYEWARPGGLGGGGGSSSSSSTTAGARDFGGGETGSRQSRGGHAHGAESFTLNQGGATASSTSMSGLGGSGRRAPGTGTGGPDRTGTSSMKTSSMKTRAKEAAERHAMRNTKPSASASTTSSATQNRRADGTVGGGRGGSEVEAALREEIRNMQVTVDGLETERDYYFHKLREIEILSQTLDPTDDASGAAIAEMDVPKLVCEVQRILYKEDHSAEEGAAAR